MRTYYGWTITKNSECKAYPWNIYSDRGEYICSCSTLEEAKFSIRENISNPRKRKEITHGGVITKITA